MEITDLTQLQKREALKELGILYFSKNVIITESIRERYSINDEVGILRQRDTKPEEYEEYNLYVEECKARASELWKKQEETIKKIVVEVQ